MDISDDYTIPTFRAVCLAIRAWCRDANSRTGLNVKLMCFGVGFTMANAVEAVSYIFSRQSPLG